MWVNCIIFSRSIEPLRPLMRHIKLAASHIVDKPDTSSPPEKIGAVDKGMGDHEHLELGDLLAAWGKPERNVGHRADKGFLCANCWVTP